MKTVIPLYDSCCKMLFLDKGKHMSFRLTCILAVVFILFFQGIIRHDVPKTKYIGLAAQPEYDCVGRVFYKDKPAGSCVLIGNKTILSAAHVFPELKSDADISSYSFQFKNATYTAEAILIHPDYIKSEKQKADLVLITLKQPADVITLPNLNTAFDELKSVVTGAGFGAFGKGNSTDTRSSGEKIAGENVIDSIVGPDENGKRTILLCDFDSPTPTKNPLGDAGPLPLEYITTGGDSGGGLFRSKNGKMELVGILHGGGIQLEPFLKYGFYGQVMEWTRVSCYSDWITGHTKN